MYIKLPCTTEALEIKGAANSVCLRRIVVQSAVCGLGVYGCGLGVYGVRFRSVWNSVVQTSYITPTSGYTKPHCGCNVTYYLYNILSIRETIGP